MAELTAEEQVVKSNMLAFLKEGAFEIKSSGGKIHVNVFDKVKFFVAINKIKIANMPNWPANAELHWFQRRDDGT